MMHIQWGKFCMKEKIIYGVYGVISLALFLLLIIRISNLSFTIELMILLFALILNPLLMERLLKKCSINKANYIWGLKFILLCLGVLFALIVATVVFNVYGLEYSSNVDIEHNVYNDYTSTFTVSVFVIYLGILWLCTSEQKHNNYIVFGLFYLLCVVLGYFSKNMEDSFIKVLNMIPQSNLDKSSYKLLTECILDPIKESILTYIIFDTVTEEKDRKLRYGGKKDKLMEDKEGQLRKEAENHIIVEDERIVLENITSNIELETSKMNIFIKQK